MIKENKSKVNFILNGTPQTVFANQIRRFSDVLREDLGLIALEQGAKLVSDEPKEVIEEVTEVADEEPEIVIESAEPENDGFEELVAVMKGLIETGDPDNFKTDGTPKAAVVNKLSGSTITTEQREAAWEEALNAG